MVHFSAPEAQDALQPVQSRDEQRAATGVSTHWTQSFVTPVSHRTGRAVKPLMWLLAACAFYPVGLWSRSQADEPTPSPKTAEADSSVAPITPPIAATAATADQAPVQLQAPDALQKALAPLSELRLPKLPSPILGLPLNAGRTLDVRVVEAGKTRQGRVTFPLKGGSVRDALSKMGITLSHQDRVFPPAATAAYDGLTIRVQRVKSELQTHHLSIAPQMRFKPTPAIARGAKQVLRNGRPGAIAVTERVWSVDGKATRRQEVSRRVVRQPQDAIIGLGSRKTYIQPPYHNRYARALAYRGGSPRNRFYQGTAPVDPNALRPVKMLIVTATGYAAGPAGGSIGNYTATGLRAGYGAIAVDPRVIPLGSRLYVEGYGYGFACDTGGAIKGHHIDLCFDSASAAMAHGRRTMKVWILGK